MRGYESIFFKHFGVLIFAYWSLLDFFLCRVAYMVKYINICGFMLCWLSFWLSLYFKNYWIMLRKRNHNLDYYSLSGKYHSINQYVLSRIDIYPALYHRDQRDMWGMIPAPFSCLVWFPGQLSVIKKHMTWIRFFTTMHFTQIFFIQSVFLLDYISGILSLVGHCPSFPIF